MGIKPFLEKTELQQPHLLNPDRYFVQKDFSDLISLKMTEEWMSKSYTFQNCTFQIWPIVLVSKPSLSFKNKVSK